MFGMVIHPMPDTSQATCQFSKTAEFRHFPDFKDKPPMNPPLNIGKYSQMLASAISRLVGPHRAVYRRT
jgi:hypothetical protein